MEVKAPNKVDTRDKRKTQKQNILIWCNTPGIHLLGACAQSLSRVRLCDPMDCSLPGFSVHRISQARILEWVAISSSRGSSRLRGLTCISCIGRWIVYHCTTWESPFSIKVVSLNSWEKNASTNSHSVSIGISKDFHESWPAWVV